MRKMEVESEADLGRGFGNWDHTNSSNNDNGPPKIRSILDIGSIRSYDAQKLEFVVPEIIAAGTITAITGESGSGKTTLTTALASSVERGIPFCGLATQRRPVLILDKENPLPVVVERFDRLGITDSANFRVWGGWLPEEAPAPSSPLVMEWVAGCEPKPLVVVDSLIAFLDGDENSASEVRGFMHQLRLLTGLGATVIILHHVGKADTAKEYRGSSDIKGSIDIGYHLANLNGDSSCLTTLRLRAFKARFSVQSEVILHYEDGQFKMDNRSPSVPVEEALIDLLRANPGVTKDAFEELTKAIGISRSRTRDFLASGQLNGTIRVDIGERNSKLHSWAADSKQTEPINRP